MNPYTRLGIRLDPNLKYLKESVKYFGELSDKQYDELMQCLEMKPEREQEDILLDKLIQYRYESHTEGVERQVRSSFPLDTDPSIIEAEIKRREEKLRQAYEMINTKEKREMLKNERNEEPKDLTEEQSPNNERNEEPKHLTEEPRWSVKATSDVQETLLVEEKNNECIIIARLGIFQYERIYL